MYELALFAGAGGGLLATQHLLGWRTVCYVENAAYPVQLLQARIRDGYLDNAPIWDDARTFDGTPWRGAVDILTAGFPCQPFSRAGKGLAERDHRNLWPDTIRIIREVRPRWVLLENVSRLLSHAYVRRIFGDLAESGYDCRWDCIPASAIGANHQRDRLWIVAHTDSRCNQRAQNKIRAGRHTAELCCEDVAHAASERRAETRRLRRAQSEERITSRSQAVAYTNGGRFQEHAQLDGQSQDDTANRSSRGEYVGGRGDQVANSDRKRLPQRKAEKFTSDLESTERQGWWEVEPALGRVVDGLAHRVDRLAAIGEGQVPAVVAVAWKLLKDNTP